MPKWQIDVFLFIQLQQKKNNKEKAEKRGGIILQQLGHDKQRYKEKEKKRKTTKQGNIFMNTIIGT